MPIEIKELHLKFNLDGQEVPEDLAFAQTAKPERLHGNKVDPQWLIDHCVEEVMRQIAEKEEER